MNLFAYATAVAAAAGATGLRLLLDPWLGDDVPWIFYFFAIVFAGWVGGLGPGLLTTALCLIAGVFFFLPPHYSFQIAETSGLIQVATFAALGCLISWLLEETHRQRRCTEEEHELLRITLDSIGDAVIRTDSQGGVVGLNKVASKLTGWNEHDARGVALAEVFRIVNETTRQPVDNPALRALREGIIVGLANHTILISRDGTERPIDDSAAPIRDASGKIVGAVLVFRDVTEHRSAERALEDSDARKSAMLDTSLDGIVAMDRGGRIVEFNPAAERMFGHSRLQAVGRTLADLIVPDSMRARHREGLARYLETGEGRILNRRLELLAVKADGTEFPVEVAISATIVDDAPIFIGYIRDLTERKRAERERDFFAELAAATQPLENADAITAESARLLAERLGADRCAYAEVDREAEFVIIGDYSRGVPSIVGRWPVAAFGAECTRQMLADEAYVVEDSENDPRIGPEDVPAYRATAIRAVICVPLHKGGRFTAAMAVHQKTPRIWTAAEIDLVRATAARCWEALERAQTARRLRDSEVRFRSLVTATTAIVWDTPASGEFEVEQPGWSAFTGQSTAELLGWGWLDAVHPDDRAKTTQAWLQALQTRAMYVVEHRLRGADGEYRHMSVRAVLLLDGVGAVREWVGVHTDVTDLKAAEQAATTAQENLTTTLAVADVATWEYDASTDRVVADAQLAELFSVPVDAAVAGAAPLSQYVAAIHPEDRGPVEEAIGRTLSKGGSYEIEYRLIQSDGSIRWVIARGAGEGDGRMSGVLIDVTQRKLAEHALGASEERFRTLFDSMDEGFCVIEIVFDDDERPVDYRFLEMNPAFEKHTGLKDAVGRTVRDFVPDHESHWFETYGSVALSGEPRRFVQEARALGDRWFDVYAFRVGLPQERKVAVLFNDISERVRNERASREHEERFRALVEQVEDYAIFMTDREGRPTSWNEGVFRVLGFDEEEFVGREIVPLIFTPEDVAAGVAQAELDEAAATGRASDDRWMQRKDGTQFYATGVTTGLKDDVGHLLGFMKVMRDQTERKQMEDELRRIAADLSEADRRKNEFLATLAHELRNPLAPIRTGLELMKNPVDDPQEREEIRGTMERQAQQMVRLIDDLLEISRITQGKLELRTARVELSAVLRSAVEASRPLIDEAGHELSVDYPTQPILLTADPNRLAQVISNLLNNAAKYTPEGGRISLSAEAVDSQAVISVRDTGLGIPAEMRERIFEMYAQIDRSMERGNPGLGIGLTLVKRLVEMHEGTIEARSEGEGHGSEFIVRLPLRSDSAPPDPAPTDDGHRDAASPPPRLRALVVDDNKAAADMLGRVVRMLGNDVRTAYDGVEAVAAAEEFRPDVVLMDLGMPRLNGYEAAARIREQPWGKSITLVALTGWGQDEDRRRTEAAGFDHHLVKPAEPSALQKLLARTRTASAGD